METEAEQQLVSSGNWIAEADVTLPVVLKALGFGLPHAEGASLGVDDGEPLPHVLNVYQLGSRVYHTAEPGSDWDFLFIVPNDYEGTNLIDRGQFNACIYTLDTFQGMVRDHHFIALYSVFLPRENVWLETIPAATLLQGWTLEVSKLKKAFFMKACSSMNRAKVYCKQAHQLSLEGKATRAELDQLLRKSKKMLTHSLRYLHFGIQLFETGRIEDYMVANPYWEEARPMTSLLWEDYERRFRPTYLELMERFPRDPVQPMEQANAVPPLYRKFYCYVHSPEQTNTKNDRPALEKEILHVIVERRSSRLETPRGEGEQTGEGGEGDDLGFAVYFPEHAELYAHVERRFDELCARVQSAYDRVVESLRHATDHAEGDGAGGCEDEEKAFAKRVAGEEWKGLMFRMRRNGATAHDVLLQSVPRNVYAWLSAIDGPSS